jgi:hypothetical protein
MLRSIIKKTFAVIALLFTLSVSVSPLAFAQGSTCTGDDCGIAIGGTDKSTEFSAVTNLVKTVQTLAVRYAAPLLGSVLVIWGIWNLAVRNVMPGTIMIVCGVLMIGVAVVIKNAAAIGG